MNDGRVLIPVAIALGVGGAIGFLVATKISEAHWREIAEDEIASVKEYYQNKYEQPRRRMDDLKENRKLVERYIKPTPGELVRGNNSNKRIDPTPVEDDDDDDVHTFPEDEMEFEAVGMIERDGEDIDDNGIGEDEGEEESEPPTKRDVPYLIDYEQFVNENGYDKIDLYYYRFDDVVCDVTDRVYGEPTDQLGPDWLAQIKLKSMVFVRDDIEGIDYEVHSLSKSFNDEVASRIETDTEKRYRQIARQKAAIDTMSDEFLEADAELKRKGEKKKAATAARKKSSSRVAYNKIPLADSEKD